jgi:GDP-4-dehydro-6-deoxy-D-mannose reductase
MELERPSAAYNLASGAPVRIGQILDWILDEAGIRPEIRVDPGRVREGEVPRIQGDASRLRAETGWAPARPIEESVREVYRWTARRLGVPASENGGSA